jgi:hypothetical protein
MVRNVRLISSIPIVVMPSWLRLPDLVDDNMIIQLGELVEVTLDMLIFGGLLTCDGPNMIFESRTDGHRFG